MVDGWRVSVINETELFNEIEECSSRYRALVAESLQYVKLAIDGIGCQLADNLINPIGSDVVARYLRDLIRVTAQYRREMCSRETK